MSQEAISDLIRVKIDRGDLPSSWPDKTWGSVSENAGTTCAACGLPIPEGFGLVEVEFSGSDLRTFHPACAHLVAAICGAP